MKRNKLSKKPKTDNVFDLILHKSRVEFREQVGKQVIYSLLAQAKDLPLNEKKPRFIK